MLLSNDKHLFRLCQSIVKSENSVPFLCRSSTLKDNQVLLKAKEFHEILCEKRTCVSLKIEDVVWICQRLDKTENSVHFSVEPIF